jgi:hypothetical protein
MIKRHFLSKKIKQLGFRETNYINNRKYLLARLTKIKAICLMSAVLTLLIILLIIIFKVCLFIYKNRFSENIFLHIKFSHFIELIISFLMTYISIGLFFSIPIFLKDKNFSYINYIVRIHNILDLYSKEINLRNYCVRVAKSLLIYMICASVFSLTIGLINAFFFNGKVFSMNNLFTLSSVVLIALLIFISIYILPESNDKQKYIKNFAKFVLWLLAIALSIIDILFKLKTKGKVETVEILFYSISFLISIERIYNSFIKLKEIYENYESNIN